MRGFGFRLDGLMPFNGSEKSSGNKPTNSTPVIVEEGNLAETATQDPSTTRRGCAANGKGSSKSKAASVAPPDEDSITVVPRAKNKRKRNVASNFESDDDAPPPPSKKAAPKRKKRVETSEDEDEIAQPSKAKAPRRKKQDKVVAGADEPARLDEVKKKPTPGRKKSSKDATEGVKDASGPRRGSEDKTKEKSKGTTPPPAVPFSNPYQLQRPATQDSTDLIAPRKSRVASTPAAALSKPQVSQRPARTPSGTNGTSEPVRQPIAHSYNLSLPAPPRNQQTRISQSPSIGTAAPQGKPSPMEARASVSRDFASAYHELPTTVTNVNVRDFGRTAMFQVRHRQQEQSGVEPVAIGLPVDFVPGAIDRRGGFVVPGSGPRVRGAGLAAVSMPVDGGNMVAVDSGTRQPAQGPGSVGLGLGVPVTTVPANGSGTGSVVPGTGQQPKASGPVEDQEDWRKLFDDWSKTSEGTAALSLNATNNLPTQTQPPQAGNTDYDGIDQFLSDLTRKEGNADRRGPPQKTPKTTAASVASSSAETVNQRGANVGSTAVESSVNNSLKEYLGALEEMTQKNKNNAKLPPTTPALSNVKAHMEEALRRQRGMSSSPATSAHSSYTQSSHSRQHSGNASSRGTPGQMPAQPTLSRPSAAPVVPSMGSSNVGTLDGSGDFSAQNQQRHVSRGPETYTPAQRMQWPQWSNVAGTLPQHNMAVYRNPNAATITDPFVSVPHVLQHQGFGGPFQVPSVVRGVSNVSSQGLNPQVSAHQRMGMPMQAPTMVRRMSNASSQGADLQQRPTSAGGQMGSRTSMPPPASPVQRADRSFQDPMAQVRRDSILSAQGLIAGANSPPRLQGQYPPQSLPPRGFSASPTMQMGVMPVSNGLDANGMPMRVTPHMRPFTTPGNESFVQVRQPSIPPQRSPVQHQGYITQGNSQNARTPPQTQHPPVPSTPHRSTPTQPQQQQQQQRTPQFVPTEALRARASSIASKSPRSAASNASPRTDAQGHFHFPNCGCSFCRNAADDGDAAAGGFI